MSNTIPVIDSTSNLCQHQFENRYSIYCHDPFENQPISNELIEQLATQLSAISPVIVTTKMASGRIGKFLTADSFDVLQNQVNQKEENKDFLAEGFRGYLLDITHSAFYKGYPKLFWINFDIDRVDLELFEYGEIGYYQLINRFAVPRI